MGALTAAMAASAKEAGVEIRTNAEVTQILVKDGKVTGVALAGGEQIAAKAVVSGADPQRTLLGLLDPVHLPPSFVVKMRNYRASGTAAKINIALDALPNFAALKNSSPSDAAASLAGRIHIGPGIDYLERAFDHSKYGEFSPAPYLDISIPTILDNTLAPAGKHVMSIYMQFAPYQLKNSSWQQQRDPLRDAVIKTLSEYAPDFAGKILGVQTLTPADLESTYGLTGGHPFHGELSLDQIFTMRPLLGWARYATPVKNLYLCGNGTHPGNGVNGASGHNAAREIAKQLR
jgi:phytoene dehydrogenase-like protein